MYYIYVLFFLKKDILSLICMNLSCYEALTFLNITTEQRLRYIAVCMCACLPDPWWFSLGLSSVYILNDILVFMIAYLDCIKFWPQQCSDFMNEFHIQGWPYRLFLETPTPTTKSCDSWVPKYALALIYWAEMNLVNVSNFIYLDTW